MKKLITELKSAHVSMLKVNNAFDLRLYELNTGDYELVVFMKLQFFFMNNHPHIWTKNEEHAFIEEWHETIHDVWGNKTINTFPDDTKLTLVFDFHIQNGGWMFDHWEIKVIKIERGEFKVSYVQRLLNNVHLDSEDFIYNGYQRGAIHEFGHMIGLLDEYHKSDHAHDPHSIMHSGETIRERHVAHFVDWAEKEINKAAVMPT